MVYVLTVNPFRAWTLSEHSWRGRRSITGKDRQGSWTEWTHFWEQQHEIWPGRPGGKTLRIFFTRFRTPVLCQTYSDISRVKSGHQKWSRDQPKEMLSHHFQITDFKLPEQYQATNNQNIYLDYCISADISSIDWQKHCEWTEDRTCMWNPYEFILWAMDIVYGSGDP